MRDGTVHIHEPVLDQRQNPTAARITNQSAAGEWSVPMHQVISGERTLTITVK